MHNFRQLAVWDRALTIAEHVYVVTRDLPEEERFGLVSQMRRASVSIVSNIAEGSSRATDKEVRRYLALSRGSAAELETQVIVAERVGLMNADLARRLTREIDEVRAMLIGLATNLAPSHEA